MDKGAHFFRCDFQVHTPRDINWEGAKAVSEEERKAYAKEFIRACRSKSLDAVAITDHHDLTFFKYIKEAANSELDESNNPIPKEKKIVVFPGMELTLGIPCQAIIIFDSEFPVDLLGTLYTALSITQNDPTSDKHVQPVRMERFNTLLGLYKDLNSLDYLKNRFIVLPNVSEGGFNTILRPGFHTHYKGMPCVGGYLDGEITQLGQGNLRILNGKDHNYGPKKLGIFQTSDNRRRNFNLLGEHSTWVKWSVPTAEALRQACLARESRISQGPPLTPVVYITSIDVSGSKFMGQIYLECNAQYNAIIGGRGTGKSTILEYLRWGLCDQFPELEKDENDIPAYQDKRKQLINKTLLPFESTVQISFVKNNIPHLVRRKSATNEIFLKIGTNDFDACSEENVRNLLPIQAYSQKQLSSVGVSVEELKRLIYSPIRQTLNEFDVKFQKLRSEIRNCYELRQRKRLMEKEIEKNDLELRSLTEQVEELRKGLKGLTEEDKLTISAHKQYEVADQLVDEWLAEIGSVRTALEDIKKEIAGYPTTIPEETKLPDSESALIWNIQSQVKDLFDQIDGVLNSLKNLVDSSSASLVKLNSSIAQWKTKLNQYKTKYEAAKQKTTSQETTINQIQKIEDRVKEIRKALSEKRQSALRMTPDVNSGHEIFSCCNLSWIKLPLINSRR